MTVFELIGLLAKVPGDAKIYTAGIEGIFPAEVGNLFPIKVLQTRNAIAVYIDDGMGDHLAISEAWQPLDEFVNSDIKVLQ